LNEGISECGGSDYDSGRSDEECGSKARKGLKELTHIFLPLIEGSGCDIGIKFGNVRLGALELCDSRGTIE
jgi:hypothetical protein